jgi:outer membrane protein assembly factor BamE (lipoprotein component of BamABCDE complex)
MKYLIAALSIVIVLGGCASANKISGVQLGMTKDEVIKVMGPPTSVSAQGGREYLNYALSETDDDAFRGWTRPYYVRLINGKVESYGRSGDFDSTKTPTVRVESDQTIKQNVQVSGSGDLYTELKKLKELKDSGIITEEDFQNQKKKLLERN